MTDTATLCRIGLLIPERWRLAHRAYAALAGFFWLPCPLCGKMTGGHEWGDINGKSSGTAVPGEPGMFKGICPDCTRSGRGTPRFAMVPGEAGNR